MKTRNPHSEAQAIELQILLLRAQLPAQLIEQFLPEAECAQEVESYGQPLLTDLDVLDALYLIQLHHRGFAEAEDVQELIQARKAVNLDRVRGVRDAEPVLLARIFAEPGV